MTSARGRSKNSFKYSAKLAIGPLPGPTISSMMHSGNIGVHLRALGGPVHAPVGLGTVNRLRVDTGSCLDSHLRERRGGVVRKKKGCPAGQPFQGTSTEDSPTGD